MSSIKFGTDGWRAIIADDFTLDNVARVAEAVARWLPDHRTQRQEPLPSVVVGHDCRFGGELFAETTAKVLASHGIRVLLAKGFVSTPMISLGTVTHKADLGIIITASHNPAAYNGFKIKGPYGGPLLPEQVEEIERLIPERCALNVRTVSLSQYDALLSYPDLESLYCNHIESNFDLDAIRRSELRVAYDAMYGAGQNVIQRILPMSKLFHCEHNPGFNDLVPEPIHKNLKEFAAAIKKINVALDFRPTYPALAFGLATDGDADRIGLYDSEGKFIDSHHLILLLIKYLHEEKKLSGKVVTACSVSSKITHLCRHLGLEHEVTKIGFKHIAGKMISEDILLGGEESGGIAIKGHIPERDGIWIGLTILEYMAKSGKTLQRLIQDVYSITGPFAFERSDLHLQEELKNEIISNCEKDLYKNFGPYRIQRREDMDGFKYFFNEHEWLMIRASGTEPVLRNYAESDSPANAFSILKAAEQTLLNSAAE